MSEQANPEVPVISSISLAPESIDGPYIPEDLGAGSA